MSSQRGNPSPKLTDSEEMMVMMMPPENLNLGGMRTGTNAPRQPQYRNVLTVQATMDQYKNMHGYVD